MREDSLPIAGPGIEDTPIPGPYGAGRRDPVGDPLAKLGDIAAAAGIRRVEIVAWRDLEHPEAGGSEIHAAAIAERWAATGIDITLVASRPEQHRELPDHRDGYRIRRPAGRYGIFPAVAAAGLARRVRSGSGGGRGRPDATVEVWNGMPFFSPLWAPRPRLAFLHHVHDRMWDLVLPRHLAAAGRLIEKRIAPPAYRRTPVVTLSESSRQSILDHLGLEPSLVHVVHPGVAGWLEPGQRDPRPLVVAVGRLVTYKRFELLIDVLAGLKRRHPNLRAVIAGEGSERPRLQERIDNLGAAGWLALPGRVTDGELLSLYQRAWVVASTSAYEGWGLTLTEAAACATPAVATPIPGHRDAVSDGVTGFLAEPGAAMEAQLHRLLADPALRSRMSRAALSRSRALNWDAAALEIMRLLARQQPARR